MLQTITLPEHSLELLNKLAAPLAKQGFYLAGGTALALRYGHRKSVDLDFFSNVSFDVMGMIDFLEKMSSDSFRVLQKTEGSLCVSMCETKVELFHYPIVLLEEVEVLEGINFASVLDNGAMKFSALMNRGSKKDFYDVAQLLEIYPLCDWMNFFQAKYPTCEVLMLLRSLVWYDDAEDEPEPRLLNDKTWDGVKLKISEAVRRLT